ncbi:MAG: PIG-L family deacetylase, partial [Acidobacteriota bacterium]|nr:PIG-L family deacetylase [Acidobacteriota bacterium]
MRRLQSRYTVLACLAAVLTLWPSAFVPVATTRAQVRPTYDEGAVGLGMALRRLQTTASMLHTGAHPDDEDSALIARLARGDGARVAYLSLTRGDGGQNLIGPELFEPLGVIRTEELLQARRIDGGEQFFTRAFDFGFTKTREETATKWGEREVLADMVRVIRTFRPQVIVSAWSGTPADGHGHHQFSGYLTPLAFRAAADPKAFSEQLAEGLRPWQARKLYVRARAPREGDQQLEASRVVGIDTGRYDPLFGRSTYEIAMDGRSQHRSQGEGRLELRGPQTSGVRLSERAADFTLQTGDEPSVFAGLPVTLADSARALGVSDESLGAQLREIERDAALALEKFNALDPRTVNVALISGLSKTRQVRAIIKGAKGTNGGGGATSLPAFVDEIDFLLSRKEGEFTEALRLAAGVVVDVLSDAETVAPGESFTATARVFFPEQSPVKVRDLRLRAPDGWQVRDVSATETIGATITAPAAPREVARRAVQFNVTVPTDALATQPHWLRQQREGFLFKHPADAARGEPFAPALLYAEVELALDDNTVLQFAQPVQYRTLDPARGELRRELNVVPALSVAVDPALLLSPQNRIGEARQVIVRLINNSTRNINGRVSFTLLNSGHVFDWPLRPANAAFEMKSKGSRQSLNFSLTVPRGLPAGSYTIGVTAITTDGRTFNQTERLISYPHIQTHRLYTPAETVVKVFDLKVASVRVGYVMGSGDEVPEAIRRMGLPVTLLDENDLSISDLSSRFDTIVVGVRASQTRPDFVANNNRLLDFVRRGGALIVQYQRPDYAEKNLMPLP